MQNFYIVKIIISLVQSLSRVRLFVTPCTAACQASLSITNSQSLLKLLSIDAIQPSHPLQNQKARQFISYSYSNFLLQRVPTSQFFFNS